MPGTTRYSATFDRTYEEEDRTDPHPPPNGRRSRSLSLQSSSGLDGRPYTPLGGRLPPNQRSSSTDSRGEHIPTRTVSKTVVKAHNNPFQFVKVGACPLYRKAEEQLKKVVKKPDVLKEEEEDWQSNLDSWKSRRRKMSEEVFKRQEEIKQFELEEQIAQLSQKKTKTFSEMVESRANRGRTLSLCLLNSPLELQNWEFEGSSHKNGSFSTFSGESEENSTVNSEDEGVSLKGMLEKSPKNNTQNGSHRINGDSHTEENCSKLETNGDYNKLSELTTNNLQMKPKEGSYIDSGLESISSSHRAGDTPDSGSDFSQDSGSSIDCESPRTGVNILEEFSSKTLQTSSGQEITIKVCLNEKGQDFGFSFVGGKDEGQVTVASVSKGSKAEASNINLGDQIISIDGKDVSSKKHIEIASMIQKGREKGEISLLLWRHTKSADSNKANGFNIDQKQCSTPIKPNTLETQSTKAKSQQYEKSVESENEMYVDDFEELKRQSEMMSSNIKTETNAQANGIPTSSVSSKKDTIPKISSNEISSASKSKSKLANGSVEEPLKSEQNVSSQVDNGDDVKKTRVRRKGVYGLNVPIATNQTSKEGTTVNSLFPLSPVTELPSPEDNKSLSSALSSNSCTSVFVSQKRSSPKEKVKEAEAAPFKNKGNETLTTSAVETVSSKGSLSPKKDENKTETIVPSSPAVGKNNEKSASVESPQEEKPKLVLRRVKSKPKKVNASDNNSLPSQTTKDISNYVPPSPTSPTVKNLTNDAITKEMKSLSFSEEMQKKKAEPSPKRENNASTTATASVNVKHGSLGDSKDSLKKVENAVDSTTVSSPSALKNKTLIESSQNEKSKSNNSSLAVSQNIKQSVQNTHDGKSRPVTSSSCVISKPKFPLETSKGDKEKLQNTTDEKSEPITSSPTTSKAKLPTESSKCGKEKPMQNNLEEKPKPVLSSSLAVSKAKLPGESPKDNKTKLVQNLQNENLKPVVPASAMPKDKLPTEISKEDKEKSVQNIPGEKSEAVISLSPAVSKMKLPAEIPKDKNKAVQNFTDEKSMPAVSSSIAISKAKLPAESPKGDKEKPLQNIPDEKSKTIISSSPAVSKAKFSAQSSKSDKEKLVLNIPEEKSKLVISSVPASKAKLLVESPKGDKPKPAENLVDEKSKPVVSSSSAVSKTKLPEEKPKNYNDKDSVSLPPAVPQNKTSVENHQDEKPKLAVSTTSAVAKAKAAIESRLEEKSKPAVSTVSAVSKTKAVIEDSQEEKSKLGVSSTSPVSKIKTVEGDQQVEKSKPALPPLNLKVNTVAESSQKDKLRSIPTPPVDLKKDISTNSKDETPKPMTPLTPKPLIPSSPNDANARNVMESPQDEKPKPILRKVKKVKKGTSENISSASSQVAKEASTISTPPSPTIVCPKNLAKDNTVKETISSSQTKTKQEKDENQIIKTEPSKEKGTHSTGISSVTEITASINKTPISAAATTTTTTSTKEIQSVKSDIKKEPANISSSSSTTNIKQTITPAVISQDKKAQPTVTKKQTLKEKLSLSLSIKAVHDYLEKCESQNSPATPVSPFGIPQNSPATPSSPFSVKSIASLFMDKKNESVISSADVASVQNNTAKSPVNSQDEILETMNTRKNRNRSKKKNANSQKVNTQAKQIEECKNPNIDSLNIVYESEPKNTNSENLSSNKKNSEINSNEKISSVDLVSDVPPVEKVAEEMEKLILEQLEEEERAKELASGLQIKTTAGSPENLLITPPKLAEPPKEKPPPPPVSEENQNAVKETPLKRVNSTKRIKKEIYKRRSNFLGIDNAEESICSEPSVPPPPALEEILKAEMELDRQSRLKIESAADERLILEENEIMQKEREIIESLESEERQKQLLTETTEFKNALPNKVSDVITEEDRILALNNERMRLEAEILLNEEQKFHLMEEKQLREREEFIRKQESNVSLSGANGDGKSLTSISSTELSESKSSPPELCKNKPAEKEENNKVLQKPAVPPKPLKKKEAIRKERERLRQEQEALQREREEHRQKLIQEQEELMKQQKSHAPDVPVSRLGPLPPLVQPSFPPPLTSTMNATPNTRESGPFPSRSHHGTSNGPAGSINTAELMAPPVVRQNRIPPNRKSVQNEAWGQQKGNETSATLVPLKKDAIHNSTSSASNANINGHTEEPIKHDSKLSSDLIKGNESEDERNVKAKNKEEKMPSVRKQNQDSLTESRYNQNHWLIQEAEMRRIAELKERQRIVQLPCSQTHLAEDDVCSNPPRVPVIPPTHNQHLNFAVQDKMWNYGQPNPPFKIFPPPVVKDPLHTIYPRETVIQQPPTKPSRVVPMERQEQMLSVSGRKRCSHCNEELGRGAAMIIESLQLYYHIHCFQCCVCQAQLGNGSCGTDVRVRNNKLHCHNCYSNDEAGLKFSQV